MRKAASHKTFLLFTLLFVVIAVLSFAAFRETRTLCTDASKCSEAEPSKRNGGGMLWDDFSRRFVSVVSCR